MKKRAIITYLLALALILCACVGPFTPENESAPPHSDTSSTVESIEYSISTEAVDGTLPTGSSYFPLFGDYYTVGPYTFRYISYVYNDELFSGLTLWLCEDSLEIAVIPSEVEGIPVIGISHWLNTHTPFSENSSLKRIVIPDTVVHTGDRIFRNCDSLVEIKLSSSIKRLGDPGLNSDWANSLLEGTAVTFLEVPEGIEKLCENVFKNSLLNTIILPSSLEVVEACFVNCPIKEIFYRGTAEQCPQTLLDQVATTDATIYYLSETEPTEEGNYWHYVDGKPVIW